MSAQHDFTSIFAPAAIQPGEEPTLAAERDAGAGLSAQTIEYIAACKHEPAWMRRERLQAYHAFAAGSRAVSWAPAALAELPFEQLRYYSAPARAKAEPGVHSCEGPNEATTGATLASLGVAGEEASHLGGVQAQIDGEVVYGSLREEWARAGVVFVDASTGLARFGDLFRPHFGTVIGRDENPFTRLNAAVFSGGSFIYVPPGVKVAAPMKCFMHLQARHGTQFGRTLIVAGEGAEVTFIEGCTSVARAEPSLHCAVGEFIAAPGARIRYIALQDWSTNVTNLAILRARVAAGASVHWIDCNLGGRLTMKYPCALLEGEGASAEAVSIAVARTGQHHDSGAKMLHRAPRTRSTITSKSISLGAGRADYRGWVDMPSSVRGCRNHTECDALLIDPTSRTSTYPAISVRGNDNIAQHEASVSRISADQIFYMQQRGLSEEAARSLSVNGFVNDLLERFPMQYSMKIKRLIGLHMEGSVG